MVMSRPVKSGEYELIPEGVIQAVMVGVWDIGFQETIFKDEAGFNKMVYQVVFAWELNQKTKDGNPIYKYKTYTNSLHKKAGLRKDLLAWGVKIGDHEERVGFDFDSLIGKNCLLTIAHKESGENTFANIVGISGLPAGMNQISPTRQISMPKWVFEKIKPEHKAVQDAAKNPVAKMREENVEGVPF